MALFQRVVDLDLGLSAEASGALTPGMNTGALLAHLNERGLHADALRVLAHALPPRQAIWWGCLCVWHVVRPRPGGAIRSALESAFRWVREPSEPNRQATGAAGEAAGSDTPAGCLALSVHRLGDSPNADRLAALAAQSLTGAVLLASVQGDPQARTDRCRRFLRLAEEIASNKLPWD